MRSPPGRRPRHDPVPASPRRAWSLPALVLALAMVWAAPARAVTVEEVISMARAGVSADIIKRTIGGQRFTLTPEQLRRLRSAQVPEEIIAVMSGTTPASEPQGATALSRARRATDEFRRAEQARRAREAQEAQEARRREAAQIRAAADQLRSAAGELTEAARSAAVETALRRGMDAIGRGDHQRAARELHELLRGGLVPPNTYRYVDGEYGLAEALFAAGLPQAAARHYVEVLRRGPRTRRFAPAFFRLREIAATGEFTHPIYQMLAALDVSKESVALRDEYHYALGEFYERFGTPKEALSHFGMVSERGARAPAATYRRGLLLVRTGQNRAALRALEEAATAAHARGQLEIRDLAFLALARVAFEVGSWGAASSYYHRIAPSSRFYVTARHELLWTQFMAQDHRAALGTLQTMHAPRFRGEHLPDRFVIEATIYLDMCRFDEAQEALENFRRATTPTAKALEKFLSRQHRDEEVLSVVRRQGALPEPVRQRLLRDVDAFLSLSTYLQLEGELRRLKDPRFGALASELEPHLRARRGAYRDQVVATVLKYLREARADLTDLSIKANEVKLEIELAEKELLVDETMALYRGAEAQARKPTGPRRLTPHLKPTEQRWPVEGEYWADEIPHYRSFLRGACREK